MTSWLSDWSNIAVIVVLVSGIILVVFRKMLKRNPILLGAFIGGLFGLIANLLHIIPLLFIPDFITAILFPGMVVFAFIISVLFYTLLGGIIGSILRRSE